ncbi:MAG: MYXO-CTERM sorting domain-containing protein [Myxococcales bacterium]|nr:MYXO-CTERM sorting domain-containing protein [Myxococcales bacterium]
MRAALSALLLLLLVAPTVHADSVAQIATAVRISRSTAVLIDPQGRPGAPADGTDTAARPGDVLTFVAHFTPVPNGGVRGLGGYVTVYIPRNTEVVGVRFIDAEGNTVAPRRGGYCADGAGPRGFTGYVDPLVEGSLSQLYADTGVFYATDARTTRVPDGSVDGEQFLTLFNGILLDPAPTASAKIGELLGADLLYAHNLWDVIQALGFGVGGGAINDRGQGNTPDLYGSAVAGPMSTTHYPYEASYTGDLSATLVVDNVVASDTVGPWQRIQTFGAEIGARGQLPPMPDPGDAKRVGVPALDGSMQPLGVRVDGAAPLPAYDAASPSSAYTRALRFAVGELLVGSEYLSEFSLRVLDTPLDPVAGADVVCAEVFGGDASAELPDGSKDGKDNSWRYFLPAPSCVSLSLLFDLDVDRLAVLTGDPINYTLRGKNLSTQAHDNAVIRHCYVGGDVSFVSASDGGVDQAATGCPPSHNREVIWNIAAWQPGAEFEYQLQFEAGGAVDTVGRAIFTSDQLPDPGFSTVAYTVIDQVSIMRVEAEATPTSLAAVPGQVEYLVRLQNDGTGTADMQQVIVELPPGFSYVAGSASVDGTTVGDPAAAGGLLTFSDGLASIPAGSALELTFSVDVADTVADGSYGSRVDVWFTDPFKGETVNDSLLNVAEVLVGVVRSEPPSLDAPIAAGVTVVSGSTSAPAGSTVRIYIGGLEAGSGVSDASGGFAVSVPALFGGQRVSATVQASGEFESLRSVEVAVSATAGGAACSDGIDNDGDGKTDFPDDPDCSSATDPEEAYTPACSDGVDNDSDGKTDFGSDPGCASLIDDDESGTAACGDGVDNDGDGKTDFPDDPGCDSADDVNEVDLPECADGVDNDGDGKIDYPADPDCASALDDESLVGDGSAATGGGGTAATGGDGTGQAGSGAGGSGAGSGAGGAGGDGTVGDAGAFEHGGVDAPGQLGQGGGDGGCGCAVVGAPNPAARRVPWLLAPVAALAWRRRRRA